MPTPAPGTILPSAPATGAREAEPPCTGRSPAPDSDGASRSSVRGGTPLNRSGVAIGVTGDDAGVAGSRRSKYAAKWAGSFSGSWSAARGAPPIGAMVRRRSEEHTSELQSQFHLVCRLLLEKKKK